MTIPRKVWIAVALVTGVVLFWAATSDAVYELTSPSALSIHVVLRKAYSIVAFALVGLLADKALGPVKGSALRAALLVGAYSAAIEYAQWRDGSHEGPAWNAIDTLCGVVGGWLGVQAERVRQARRA